ncbi:hypothetical protein CCO02nite_28160 [Cellulomonas composti]|uniref:Uncharacterized protein n=1 Tax=Cellulomonas composti TaxID=266130 RepID=A0A511JDT6_9CELL|nr:hypothetical protein CCO02nite_28160 [Cellulomonas composti]
MFEIFGPAVDAELRYRREQVQAEAAAVRAVGAHRSGARSRRGLRRSGRAAPRGWSLPGSGAWSTAR